MTCGSYIDVLFMVLMTGNPLYSSLLTRTRKRYLPGNPRKRLAREFPEMVLPNFCVPLGPRFGGAVRRGPQRHAKIDLFSARANLSRKYF